MQFFNKNIWRKRKHLQKKGISNWLWKVPRDKMNFIKPMTSLETSSEDLETVAASEITDPVIVQQNLFIKHMWAFYMFCCLQFRVKTMQPGRTLTTNQHANKWQSRMFLALITNTLTHPSHIPQQLMFELPVKAFSREYLWLGHDPSVCTFSCRC